MYFSTFRFLRSGGTRTELRSLRFSEVLSSALRYRRRSAQCYASTMSILALLFSLSMLLYAAATARLWWQANTKISHAGGLALLAVLVHAAALLGRMLGEGGWSIDWTTALNLFAWQAAALLWFFALRHPVKVLGLAAYPFGALASGVAVVVPAAAVTIQHDGSLVGLHVLLSLLAAGLLTLAAIQAALLAMQDRALHRHEAPVFMKRLPPLLAMERMLFSLITAGFVLLSLALLTGLSFIHDWLTQHLAHKTVLSMTAWLIFGGLLIGRWRLGLRGRQAARWTLVGYAMLLLAYLGAKLVLELLLGARWSA